MVAETSVMSSYSTNLTDKQWQVIKNIVETKERKHSLRDMINAMLYLAKTGCQGYVCLLLKISIRSLQYYRSSGKLPFSKISGKVYYKSSDVHEFIRKSFEEDSGTAHKRTSSENGLEK